MLCFSKLSEFNMATQKYVIEKLKVCKFLTKERLQFFLQENLRDNYSGDPNNEPLNNGLLIICYSDA